MAVMRKARVYVDTSVISAMVDRRNPERVSLTRLFWRDIGNYRAFVSDLVLLEIRKTPSVALRTQMKELARRLPSLPATKDAEELAREYTKHGAVPADFSEDAYHIAVAVINEMDFLLSWNFRHIVRQRTRDIVRMVNSRSGLHAIDILTPAELL